MNQIEQEFIKKLTITTEENLANEQFGPEQLAAKVGMSHSGLRRKLKSILNLSISQFIRSSRLEVAKKLLLAGEFTVSEIAYKVGFGSPTYFNKCFHEQFGKSPGEFKKQYVNSETLELLVPQESRANSGTQFIFITVFGALMILIVFVFVKEQFPGLFLEKEKSIAVLPVKYLGSEPDKQYRADGFQDAITLHLSKIADLRVMSRTSVEQYRETKKTARRICQEQKVTYLLESNMLLVGDSIQLTVQLIEGIRRERHIWSESYSRNQKDILSVQNEIARNIAAELNANITTEEKQRLDKLPTLNLTAFDFYQKAREEHWKYWLNEQDTNSLKRAENQYFKALECDSAFAQAYSGLAMVYWDKYYWKTFFSDQFMDSALFLANKALSFDNQLADAYTIIGQIYTQTGKRKEADIYYDKAIELNPSDYNAYSKKAFSHDMDDAVLTLENYIKAASLHRGPAFPELLLNIGETYIWAGFVDEARSCYKEWLKLTEDSLRYFNRLAFIEYSIGNWQKMLEYLNRAISIDSTKPYIYLGLGHCYTHLHDFQQAKKSFQKMLEIIKSTDLAYINEMHRVAYAFWKNNLFAEASFYFDVQMHNTTKAIEMERNCATFFHYDLAGLKAFQGDKESAYKNLIYFFDNTRWKPLWLVTLIKIDPLFDRIKSERKFQEIVLKIEKEYLREHERVEKWMAKNHHVYP